MNPDFLKRLAEITKALRDGLTQNPLDELQKRAVQTGEGFGYQLEHDRAQAGYAKAHPKSLRAQQEMMANGAMLALGMLKPGEKPVLTPAIRANGRVYDDLTHAHAYMRAGITEPLPARAEGFIDQNSKWYSRQAAEKLIDRFLSKSVKAQVAERSRQAGRSMGLTTEDVNGKLYANRGTKADEPMTLDDLNRIMAKKNKGKAALDSVATRLGPPSAEQLHKLLTENKGFTVDPRTGETVSNGYAVGGGNQAGILLQQPMSEMTPKSLQAWLDQHAHKIAPDQALGGWVDDKGVAYIEPSTKVNDLNEAQRLGNERGEKAIWDHANAKEIPLKVQKAEDAADKSSEMTDILNKWQSVFGEYQNLVASVPEISAERGRAVLAALRNPEMMPVSPVYHSTRDKSFSTFDPKTYGQTGSHFGTRMQANDIVDQAPKAGVLQPRTFEAQLHLKNPLRLVDRGGFDAAAVAQQLREKGILSQKEADDIVDSHILGESSVNPVIHEALRLHGHDGIVYMNRHEGLGFGQLENNVDKWELVEKLNELHDISDEEFRGKYPQAKDSYIAFNPEQIKVKRTFTPGAPYAMKFNQRDLERPSRIVTPQKIADVEELAHKAFTGPKFLSWLREGRGMGHWYDTRRTQGQAIDALGDELGPKAFNDLIDHMAASTAMSRPANNLRRASWWRALNMKGLLDPAELRTSTLAAPEGMGHIAQRTHHFAVADLVQNKVLNALTNPKPASFAENLKMNWRPYTNDTRMATASLQAEPKLALGLAGKQGDATPRKWAYAPIERAAQRAAAELYGRGLVDSPPVGVDPTAAWQAQVWGGIGKEGNRGMGLKPSPFAGNFADVVDKLIARSAKLWGVTPARANELFWSGQPLDLPLDASLLKGPARPRKK